MIEYWNKFKAIIANDPYFVGVVIGLGLTAVILATWFLWPSDVSDPVHDVKQSETRIELEKTKEEAATYAETGKELHKEVEKAEKVLEVTKKLIVKRKSDVKKLEIDVVVSGDRTVDNLPANDELCTRAKSLAVRCDADQ